MSAKLSENILQPKRQNIVLPPVQQLLKSKQGLQPLGSHNTTSKSALAISPKANNNGPANHEVSSSSKPRTVTMDKRNARERNRVKLVNQGFQTLKTHIPDDFRVKKMSKVDTLKCALDYIRFLEQTLDEDPDNDQLGSQQQSGFTMTEAEINEHLNKICGGSGDDSNISLDPSSSSINSDLSPNRTSSTSLVLDESAIDMMEDQKPLVIDASQFVQLPQSLNCTSGLGPQMAADMAGVLLPLGSMEQGSASYIDENFNPENVQYVQIVEILALPQ